MLSLVPSGRDPVDFTWWLRFSTVAEVLEATREFDVWRSTVYFLLNFPTHNIQGCTMAF